MSFPLFAYINFDYIDLRSIMLTIAHTIDQTIS